MTPRALTLAALVCAAVPGTAPVSAVELSCQLRRGADRFHTAVVSDQRGARWVVRLPVDAAAAARQDAVLPFLRLLARRVPFKVPDPIGRMAVRDGRGAIVYPYLEGAALSLTQLPPRSGLAASIGRALAAVHNLDRRLVDEAALPLYEAEECRRRRLADLDRAAATRRVPTGLLSRWERMLDDVSLWRFAPTVVHGRLDGARILIAAKDHDDIETAYVAAVVGWDEAGVSDPATDFAAVIGRCSVQAADTVMEAYAMAREEPVDRHLSERAHLIAELAVVTAFLAAVLTQDHQAIARLGAELTDLDARVGDRAPARAESEPLSGSAPLEFAPEPLGASQYQASEVDAGRARLPTDRPEPQVPAPPALELDARQQGPREQPAQSAPSPTEPPLNAADPPP